ncbi:MAG: hypothetical protein ACLRFP_03820 [Alphaproteobacteria bacterium]|jgi:hypothetical protein
MAISVQQFVKLANLYNQTMMTMSAICVQKGGIAMENYVGRFYAADLLEYIVEYGGRLVEEEKNLPQEIKNVVEVFRAKYEAVKKLTTPTQKPMHEMTLEEFEKVMNI